MDNENIIQVYTRDVACQGELDDHPLVYYNIPVEEGRVTCGYCNRTFVYTEAEV